MIDIKKEEKVVLRQLAEQVAEAASLPVQSERARLWTACNSLKPKRAMVLLDPQNGWEELVPQSSLVCRDPFFRSIELHLRRTVFRHEHIHDDFPIQKRLNVWTVINKGDYGVENKVVRPELNVGAYHIEPSIKNYDDLKKMHPAEIIIDRKKTAERLDAAKSVLGDILDVQPRGVDGCRCGLTRILVHLRGLEQMMLDMYDNPEMLHELMAFLRDQQIREYDFFEKEGVLSLNNNPDYITGTGGIAHTDELPSDDFTGTARLKDMIVWGESQEFVGVGPEQFNEFVLQYQLPILNRFGLVDYGCCESLDRKFDLLIKNIPKLRWAAVSPWCNREKAAEKLGGKYVYVYKPNPSYICSEIPDFQAAENNLRETLEIAQGCAVHIVMKDTSTFWNDKSRVTKWTDIAMRVVQEMA